MKNLKPGNYKATITEVLPSGEIAMSVLIDGKIVEITGVAIIPPALVFMYTTEDLLLLQEVYLNTVSDELSHDRDDNNFYGTRRCHEREGIESFTDWLMQEDRTKLL